MQGGAAHLCANLDSQAAGPRRARSKDVEPNSIQ